MPTESIELEVRVRVNLPLALRPESGGVAAVDVDAPDVASALAALCARHPTLRRHVFDESGALRHHVNVFVNEADVRTRDGLATRLMAGDEVHVVPSIAGG